MKFIYWDNKVQYHDKQLAEIEALTVSEADKDFEKKTGLNPVKNNWISCQPVQEITE